jgi:histidinol dehydrogenase
VRIIRDEHERPPASPRPLEQVAEIIAAVRRGGDATLLGYTERFDGARLTADDIRVKPASLTAALTGLDAAVRDGLETAIENVRSVAEAQLRDPVSVGLPQGQRVELAEVAVARAGVYVPGGRAAYPSSVVMGTVPASTAGVGDVAVCAPPAPDGSLHPVVLAACALCGVSEVYRMGGAQAIAALAYGTESVTRVDLVVGPGNPWVTEAKRQVFGAVGIDGLAGPSELTVIAGGDADPELVALDLLAQAEHGADSPLELIALEARLLEEVVGAVQRMAPERPSVTDAALRVRHVRDARAALSLAEQIAPEHLELIGSEAEALADEMHTAGCVFVGAGAATAFGDYVAGSNHVLPTGGAARFQSALSPATFRRVMARVSLPGEAPARLAPAGAALARAEGFPVHAESMERRA